MNIQQIDYILTVAKLKSFGKAAEKCFITQSTLSTMIGRFEKEIGITIFDRTTKPISITKEGLKLIGQLQVISKELENLNEVVQELKGETVGTITIGIIPTVAPYLFPYFLRDFIQKHPQVKFEITELPTEQIVKGIKQRELDIGILSIPLDQPNLIEIPLYNETFLLYDKAAKQTKKKVVIDEIDLDRLWLLEEGHCMRNQVEKICNMQQQRLIGGNLIYKSGTIDTLMKFVNHNNGVTLLPKLAALQLSSEDQKHLKRFESPTPVRQIGLLVHNQFVKTRILDALVKEIKKTITPVIRKSAKQDIVSPLK